MRITLKQLEIFINIAKTENMNQAAEKLHLSQSACSMALSTLEKQLSTLLFDRHNKRLILNERGRFLLPKAVHLIAQAQELQNALWDNHAETISGHLIIGASMTIGNYLLPNIISHFIELHPQTRITLKIANTETIVQQLLSFEIDLALVEGNCQHNDIESSLWGKDKLVVITSPKDPLVKKIK